MAYTLVTSNSVSPSNVSWQLITLTANIVLSWTSSFSTGPTIASINDVNPDQPGRTITMPNATLGSNGQNFLFNNISIYSFNILANDGVTVISTIATGEIKYIYLFDTTTANGQWRVTPFGGGTNAIVNLTTTSSDGSIVITGGIITPPGGVINFVLPTSIADINNVSDSGFLVNTSTSPAAWGTAILQAGDNIQITNPNGVAGNPVIAVNSTISSLTSLQVGDFSFSGQECIATSSDQSLHFATIATGVLDLNEVLIDTSSNISVPGSLTVAGTVNTPLMPKAFVVFTDTTTLLGNTIVIEDSQNVSSVTGSNGTYVINFSTNRSNTLYGVSIDFGSSNSPLPPMFDGAWIVRDVDAVTIVVTDASGELVTDAQNGILVQIMASS